MENIYDELICLFLNDGYEITDMVESGMEAHGKNEFVFSMMKDGEYFEAVLYLADNDAVVSYDILSSEYQTDIFVDNPINQEKTSQWHNKLATEIKRLKLENFKM
ncbi:hypothetical protein [Fusobacterium sp.]|uniref:hypothetical protein n=1 Tax=Fusobacterium sp. TaxID=68766 RepID=UPI0028FFC0A0|nr:hypothetical protein [Fusobacterium sp.]MDU1911570.1 hypothetical protein [Fusobacterium sp.]